MQPVFTKLSFYESLGYPIQCSQPMFKVSGGNKYIASCHLFPDLPAVRADSEEEATRLCKEQILDRIQQLLCDGGCIPYPASAAQLSGFIFFEQLARQYSPDSEFEPVTSGYKKIATEIRIVESIGQLADLCLRLDREYGISEARRKVLTTALMELGVCYAFSKQNGPAAVMQSR